MVRILILMLISIVGFCYNINWSLEFVDSLVSSSNEYDFGFNALAINSSNTPYIVYNIATTNDLVFAHRTLNNWQKEIIETGRFYACFSLIFDKTDIPHLSYYSKNDSGNMTYMCYAHPDTLNNWSINIIDSIYGIVTNHWFQWGYYKTSIALDSLNFPGIAYSSWNSADSIHYIKYAHFNGTSWDISIVEYDSNYVNVQTAPTDYCPELDFDLNNHPFVAFHQIFGQYDTIKLAYFDDTLNKWIVNPVINWPYGGKPISFQFNQLDLPGIAHGWDASVAYSWFDGSAWHTEGTGCNMGWIGVKIILDIDKLDHPHITYLPDPMIAHPSYTYKSNSAWFDCGWIEPDSSSLVTAEISFKLDSLDQPHVCYPVSYHYLKYAKGTFVSVEENKHNILPRLGSMKVLPNPFKNAVRFLLDPSDCSQTFRIKIYDSTGRIIKEIRLEININKQSIVWNGTDNKSKKVPAGIYIVQFSTRGFIYQQKIIKIK